MIFHDTDVAMFSFIILKFNVNINCFTYINHPIIFHLREHLWGFKCQTIYAGMIRDLVFGLSFHDFVDSYQRGFATYAR